LIYCSVWRQSTSRTVFRLPGKDTTFCCLLLRDIVGNLILAQQQRRCPVKKYQSTCTKGSFLWEKRITGSFNFVRLSTGFSFPFSAMILDGI